VRLDDMSSDNEGHVLVTTSEQGPVRPAPASPPRLQRPGGGSHPNETALLSQGHTRSARAVGGARATYATRRAMSVRAQRGARCRRRSSLPVSARGSLERPAKARRSAAAQPLPALHGCPGEQGRHHGDDATSSTGGRFVRVAAATGRWQAWVGCWCRSTGPCSGTSSPRTWPRVGRHVVRAALLRLPALQVLLTMCAVVPLRSAGW